MITRFLCYCAGTKWEVLEQCPSQKPKYAGIGATILLTAVLATISGGYALYHVFSDEENRLVQAVLFGLVWGITIFNLDRLIVLSIHKKKDRSILKEGFQVLPRVILAVFIAIIIAKPLEIRIFEESINDQLKNDSTNVVLYRLSAFNLSFDTGDLSERYESRKTKADSLKMEALQGTPNSQEYKRIDSDIRNAEANLRNVNLKNESNYWFHRKALSNILVNQNVRFISDLPDSTAEEKRLKSTARDHYYERERFNKLMMDAADSVRRLKARRTTLVKEYRGQLTESANLEDSLNVADQKRINTLDSLRRISENSTIEEAKKQIGLMAQIKALGKITAYQKTKTDLGEPILNERGEPVTNALFWANIAITLLFLMLETAPILVKLMMKRSVYDELIEFTEEKERASVLDEGGMSYEIEHQKNEVIKEAKVKTIQRAINHWAENNWSSELEHLRSEKELLDFTDRVMNFSTTESPSNGAGLFWKRFRVPVVTFIAILLFTNAILIIKVFGETRPTKPSYDLKPQVEFVPESMDSTVMKK